MNTQVAKQREAYQVKKQSLNHELANLCKADDGLRQAVANSSATKAKSGGVRNTNFV